MKARLSIVAGLIVGVAVAGLMLGGLLALAPDPPAVASPTEPLVIETPSPTPKGSIPPRASASPSVSASASASATASGSIAAGLTTILPGVDVTP
jgi:hypothetical protein